MREPSQRLYDCMTEIGEEYLEEAWNLVPKKEQAQLHLHWKKWTALAASLLLVAGIGLILPELGMGSSTKGEAPAASAPAMSAPAAVAPEIMDEETENREPVVDGSQVSGSGNTRILQAGQQVAYPDGRIGVLLSEEEAEKRGIIFADDLNWDGPVLYLEYRDRMYCSTEKNTGIVLYAGGNGFDVISDGKRMFVVARSGE